MVDVVLRLLVRQLLAAADPGADDLGVRGLAAGVQLDRPQQRGPFLAGQQAGRALGQHGRVQRAAGVGTVEGLAAPVRLAVDRVARADERGHVGDGVRDREAAVRARGDVQRLVEVLRAGRVDGEELEVGPVELRQARGRGGPLGGRQHLRRERVRHLELGADAVQPAGDVGGVGGLQQRRGQADPRGGHVGLPPTRVRGGRRRHRAHSPDSAVRTRMRPHSSQRSTSSGAVVAYSRSSLALTSSWQPVQRRCRSSAAPTPPLLAAILV